MNNTKTYLVIISFFLISLAFWTFVFTSTGKNDRNTGRETDELSNQSFNKTSVNSDRGPNPNTPYFIGFNLLAKYGIPADDQRYIRDVITNDTLYRLKKVYAKISYVDGSLKTPKNNGLKSTYSFDYGINNGDIHTIVATTDLSDNTINIVLKKAQEKKFDKTFVIAGGP